MVPYETQNVSKNVQCNKRHDEADRLVRTTVCFNKRWAAPAACVLISNTRCAAPVRTNPLPPRARTAKYMETYLLRHVLKVTTDVK